MLLLLLCLLLSCWAPSSPSPLRPTKSCPLSSPSPVRLTNGCPPSSLLIEVIQDVQRLQGRSETMPPNNITLMMEKGEENPVVYLEEFINALENSRMKNVTQKLRLISDASKTCTGWLKHKWEPMEDYDFFKNLGELLKFLNTYNF